MFEGFKRHRINVGEVEIACVVAGEGEPVLMLHGFPQTMAVWAQIAPALVEQGHQVVCADLRGYAFFSLLRVLPCPVFAVEVGRYAIWMTTLPFERPCSM